MSKVAVFQDTQMVLFEQEEPRTQEKPCAPKSDDTEAMKLVWKREPKKLASKRHIICEVPELLMKILEHDYSKGWEDAPDDPIEIRYYWGRGDRGAAWGHLMHHAPIIEVGVEGDMERFKPVFEPKKHPYRKRHGPNYWSWAVYRWELIPPPEEKSGKQPRNEELPRTREDAGNKEVCTGHR